MGMEILNMKTEIVKYKICCTLWHGLYHVYQQFITIIEREALSLS